MGLIMNTHLADEATAISTLKSDAAELERAAESATAYLASMRNAIVAIRPLGTLTVSQISEAVGRSRNWVDAVWSLSGNTVKGKQTRVVSVNDPEKTREHFKRLSDLATWYRNAVAAEADARARRDKNVAMVYASKLLGPGAIAEYADVDRNHVLRISRKAGVPPQHRTSPKNQYSKREPTPV